MSYLHYPGNEHYKMFVLKYQARMKIRTFQEKKSWIKSEQQTQVSDSTQIQFDKLKKLSQFKGKKPWIHIKYKKKYCIMDGYTTASNNVQYVLWNVKRYLKTLDVKLFDLAYNVYW